MLYLSASQNYSARYFIENYSCLLQIPLLRLRSASKYVFSDIFPITFNVHLFANTSSIKNGKSKATYDVLLERDNLSVRYPPPLTLQPLERNLKVCVLSYFSGERPKCLGESEKGEWEKTKSLHHLTLSFQVSTEASLSPVRLHWSTIVCVSADKEREKEMKQQLVPVFF